MRPHAESPRVSRQKHAASLVSRAQSQGGMALLVDGLAGMGKTFLLHEIMRQGRESAGWEAHYTRADEVERDEPLSFIDRFITSGIAPYGDFITEGLRQPIPVARMVLRGLFAEKSVAGRIIVIDDAQWIDAQSVRVLRYLMPRVVRRNIFLAFGVRSPHAPGSFGEFLLDAVTSNPLDEAYHVEPLRESEIRGLAIERFSAGISQRNVQQILEASGGSFLGVQTILDQLTEDEISRLHLTWDMPIRAAAPYENPLLNNYRSLSSSAQATTQIVCLAGHEISYSDLSAAAQYLGEELNLAEAIQAGVLAESSFGYSIIPAHWLIGHAVHTAVSPQRKRDISAALAQVTEGFRAVKHALTAATTWDQELSEMVDEYVHSATESGAFANADKVLQAALKLVTDPSTRNRLLIDTALVNLRAKTGYRLLPLAESYAALPQTLMRELITVMIAAHRVEEGFPHAKVAAVLQAETEDPDEQSIQAFLAFMMVLMTMRSSDPSTISVLIPIAMKLFSKAPKDPHVVKNPLLRWIVAPDDYHNLLECYLLVNLHQSGQIAEAKVRAKELTPRVLGMKDGPLKVDALVAIAGAEVSFGHIRQAHKLAQIGVDLMDHVDTPWSAGNARLILAHCEKLLGHHHRAFEMVSLIDEIAYDVLELEVRPLNASLRASLESVMGTADPTPALTQAQRLHDLEWEAYGSDFALMATCEVARAAGDDAKILMATQSRQATSIKHTRRGFLTFRAHALMNTGQAKEAAELIEELADMRGSLWLECWGTLEWLQARLAEFNGQDEQARELYEIAITADDFPLPHALTLHDYGKFLATRDQKDHARKYLKDSLQILTRIAAQVYIPQVENSLKLLTSSHSNSQESILSVLTPREREIALLLLEGYSNQHIAKELVITLATVRFHVSNILRKLEITSRAEVARVLRVRAEPPVM